MHRNMQIQYKARRCEGQQGTQTGIRKMTGDELLAFCQAVEVTPDDSEERWVKGGEKNGKSR